MLAQDRSDVLEVHAADSGGPGERHERERRPEAEQGHHERHRHGGADSRDPDERCDDGADEELVDAEQRRGAARHLGVVGERESGGVRHHEADTRNGEEERREDERRALPRPRLPSSSASAPMHIPAQAGRRAGGAGLKAAQQGPVGLAAGDDADPVDAEGERERRRGEAVDVLQRERRACDVREHRSDGEAEREAVPDEDAAAEERREAAQADAQAARAAALGRQRLREPQPGDERGARRRRRRGRRRSCATSRTAARRCRSSERGRARGR